MKFRTYVALLFLGLTIGTGAAQARPFAIDDVFNVRELSNAQISPDGEWIVYELRSTDVAKDETATQLWLASWNGKVARQLTQGKQGASDPQWSPDGTQLAFLRSSDTGNEDDQIWLLDLKGGEARRMTDLAGGVSSFRWSPDGRRWVLVHAPKPPVVGGWSQGGILTNYIIARDHRFKAAVSGAGAGNQISLYGSDQYVFGYEQEFGTPWNNPETWLRISAPFFKANAIRTSTLYVGGQADFNVPIVGSEQMYQALKSRRIDTQLVIYPGEHHGIRRPSFIKDLLSRYLAWYASYLKAS